MAFNRDRRQKPRTMQKIICDDCGAEAEVPFKPDGVRPVYCRDCYNKRRGRRSGCWILIN